MSVKPSDFRQSYAANYTLEFVPKNYQMNMKMVIMLPDEILFGSNQIKCYGLVGTDTPDLDCKIDTAKKTIVIDDAFSYQ
jgi:hypothetical protein